jgi:hypothetical protein
MAELLGDSFKLFYDTAASFGTPTWVEQISVGDISYDTANEQVEIPKRVAFKTYKKGRSDLTFKFTMNVDPTNTFHTAMIASINDGTKKHLAISPGAIAGGGYWHGFFMLTGPVDAALDSAAKVEVEAKVHADDTNLPAFVAFA